MRTTRSGWARAALLLGLAMPHAAEAETGRVVEIRSYNLKPGTRDRFHRLFEEEAQPLLRRFGIAVVAYGASLHDADSYYLVRAFPSLEDRQRKEDAFYGSDGWKTGPREAVLACIDSYTTVVVKAGTLKLEGDPDAAADLAALVALNQDYIRSVQTSDVRRFQEILSDDFLCSLPDGSLIDRRRFLERTAQPPGITELQAHDVDVRLMGDFAIVHARTTFTASNGRSGSGRYTDVWARRNGRWLAVSAHVTRN